MEKKVKVIFISDTHGRHNQMEDLPEADILVHAGDFMNGGRSLEEVVSFNYWLDSIPVKPENRLICAGNHDILFDRSHKDSSYEKSYQAIRILQNGIYLEDEAITVQGIKFYFSPWTPEFYGWGFNAKRGEELEAIWAKIPEDTEILVTHGPPYGVRDQITPGVENPLANHHLGCEELAKRLSKLKSLKVHAFGHIHGSRGTWQPHTNGVASGPLYINASFLTERYRPYPILPGYTLVEL